MNKPPAAALPFALNPTLCCVASGAFIGQVVLALAAARRDDPFAGLALSLIFMLAAAASLLLLLTHLHQAPGRRQPVPLKTWLWALSGGLLGTLYIVPTLLR